MRSIFARLALRLLLYPVVIYGALSLVFFWLYAHPVRNKGTGTPEDYGLAYEKLRLKTADGLELDAWFVPHKDSKKAVLVCHGYPMDKSDVLGLSAFLARDFAVLYFDFRATGRSGGFFSTGGAREVMDIDAALKFLAGRGFREAGVFGFSLGASSALLSANPAIKARVLDSPFASLPGQLEYIFAGWGKFGRPLVTLIKAWSVALMDVNIDSVVPAANTAAFAAPMLLIHGDKDTTVPPGNAALIKEANPAAELWLVEGAAHGEAHYRGLAAYEKRVRDFFLQHL